MSRIIMLGVCLLLVTAALAAPDGVINYAATLTTSPAVEPGAAAQLLDGRPTTALTFAVGTAGEGSLTFSFDTPRLVSGVRFLQGSELYTTTRYVLEYDPNGQGQFQKLLEGTAASVNAWVEQKFAPVTLRALRFRSLQGVSNGSRAHPCIAEFQIIGKPEADDMRKAGELGIAIPFLEAVRPVERTTSLVVNGRAPAVLVPAGDGYQTAREALLQGLAAFKPEAVTTIEAADPANRTVICLGSMLNNPLLERLYWNRYTFIDALTPGAGNYLIHTVYDPYPWTGGNNVIVVGCSDPAGAKAAVDAFLALVHDGKLPYVVQGGPQPLVPEAVASKVMRTAPNPTFEELTNNATLYLKTGCDEYAKKAVATLEIMAKLYAPDGERRNPKTDWHVVLPWNEETTSFAITCAWDAFEECPLINDDLRLASSNAVLQFTRDLVRNVSDWGALNATSTVAWNHTTFPLLGVYGGARYFQRYYQIADMTEKLQRAKYCFLSQARSWKPQEDSDAYMPYVPDHTAQYCLSENEMEHFTSGMRTRFSDYLIAILDNRGLGSGFGDSGLSARAVQAEECLPLGLWYTKDPGYKWLLNQYSGGTWKDPFEIGLKPEPPERLTGLNIFMMDPQIYDYMQSGPTYNEPFTRARVPQSEAFDKIAFRDNWDVDAQYLLLDGLGRGKHMHFDTNAIIEFVEGSERWLIDHDYLVRNTTEHNMLTVLRDGRGDQLVPSLAGLNRSAILPHYGYTNTYVRDDNGCDWQRQILWQRGEYFLVQDTVTPRVAGDYDLELTWKTIDSAGQQKVLPTGEFVAERGAGAAKTQNCSLVADEAASGKQALVMDATSSRIAFGADLPAGEYALTIRGYGMDVSSDSLWVSVDLAPNAAFHMPKGAYGNSTGDAENTANTPTVTLQGAGPHLILVTLRENPPMRIDCFVFRNKAGREWAFEAENLPPAPAPKQDLSRYLHIQPIQTMNNFVTNHERQGMSIPISILHQRQSGTLAIGQTVQFTSLIYTSLPQKRRDLKPVAIRANLVALQGTTPALAVFGPARAGQCQVRAASGLLTTERFALAGLRRLQIGDLQVQSSAPADLELDLTNGQGIVKADRDVLIILTVNGKATQVTCPADETQAFTLKGFVAAPIQKALASLISTKSQVTTKTAASTQAQASTPAWSAFAPDGSVDAVKTADLRDGKGSRIFVARGSKVCCLDNSGNLLWQTETGGKVKDLAFADVRPEAGDEILAGSTDTYIYVLSADGTLLDKHQMRGTPWARSFGDNPYKVYNLATADINGDGKPEIAVTMGNFDLQMLSSDFKLLWKHDYALHGSMQLGFVDSGSGKLDTILLGSKYGGVAGANALTGEATYFSYTSIGDVFYGFGDLNGDGKPEVINGSSTGDMVATPFGYGKDPLWHFDNFGFPVNRVQCADLNGDGKAEVLVASGTGYLYVLDGNGKVLWQDRVGQSVTDVLVIGDAKAPLVAYAEESGIVRLADGTGKRLAEYHTGAPARMLTEGPDGALLVGLGDGRVMAFKH